MTIANVVPASFNDLNMLLMQWLQSGREYIYRGQGRASYTLETTWHRQLPPTTEPDAEKAQLGGVRPLREWIDAFRVGLIKLDQEPFATDNLLDWLEFARHHGVPTPCLDFTRSPFIALFFAYNTLEPAGPLGTDPPAEDDAPGLLMLDVDALCEAWATRAAEVHWDHVRDQYVEGFRIESDSHFRGDYPLDRLHYLPVPGGGTRRMHVQQGVLIYDTLDYPQYGVASFEELIAGLPDPEPDRPILTRVRLDRAFAREVFTLLEAMNILGRTLFESPEGVAMDLMNARHYAPRTITLRGV